MPGSGSEPIVARVLGLGEVLLETREQSFVSSDEVLFIEYQTETKRVHVYADGGRVEEAERSINVLERGLPDRFVRVGRFRLVNLDRVHAVSGRKRAYRLHFKETDRAVLVSRRYEHELEGRLGVWTLAHLTPFHPFDRLLRQHELVDFGAREVPGLDFADESVREAFRDRWDLKHFSYERLKRYFGEATTENVDTTRLIRNLIWQRFRWIQWGAAELVRGDLRTLWYQVEAALEHHPELAGQFSVNSYYEGLNYLIVRNRLFHYRDMGFLDERAKHREIGTERPGVLLFSEKIGHFYRLEEMAAPYGITYGCTKGRIAHIMVEYLAEELLEAGVDPEGAPLEIFIATDFDYVGEAIARELGEYLEKETVFRKAHVHQLVSIEHFTDKEISRARTPLARYTREGGRPVPYGETPEAEVEKALAWFEGVNDPRLQDSRQIGGQKVYTVWKLSADALPWPKIAAVFERQIGELLAGETRRPGKRPSALGVAGARVGRGGGALEVERLERELRDLGREEGLSLEELMDSAELTAADFLAVTAEADGREGIVQRVRAAVAKRRGRRRKTG